MNASIILKRIYSAVLCRTGIFSLALKHRSKNGFVILMYHRVLPSHIVKEEGIQEGMYVRPETFEQQITFLKEHFEIQSTGQFKDYLRRDQQFQKPCCLITFDDGWYDFYQYAFPILFKYNAPATVFLPTDYIGTTKRFWTTRLAELLIQLGSVKRRSSKSTTTDIVTSTVNEILTYAGPFHSRLERFIDVLKSHTQENIEEILSILNGYVNGSKKEQRRDFMSWDEVREVHKANLITFGSHTASHKILTMLSMNEVRKELRVSMERLVQEGISQIDNIPFCYPNGNYDDEIATMVEESGYKLAFTTKNGWNSIGQDAFTLKRIGIHEDMTHSIDMFACILAGLL